MIDTVSGAKSSAIIYSIAETAKANGLKPYDYFEYLLTEILTAVFWMTCFHGHQSSLQTAGNLVKVK